MDTRVDGRELFPLFYGDIEAPQENSGRKMMEKSLSFLDFRKPALIPHHSPNAKSSMELKEDCYKEDQNSKKSSLYKFDLNEVPAYDCNDDSSMFKQEEIVQQPDFDVGSNKGFNYSLTCSKRLLTVDSSNSMVHMSHSDYLPLSYMRQGQFQALNLLGAQELNRSSKASSSEESFNVPKKSLEEKERHLSCAHTVLSTCRSTEDSVNEKEKVDIETESNESPPSSLQPHNKKSVDFEVKNGDPTVPSARVGRKRRNTRNKVNKNTLKKRVLKLPRVGITITAKEIQEDWMKITGTKYKGPKNAPKKLENLQLCKSLVRPHMIKYFKEIDVEDSDF